MHNHIGCICLNFLDCMFSNVSSNCTHSHIGCIRSDGYPTCDGDEKRKIQCEITSSPGEDILDLQACSDIVSSDFLSDDEKQQALSKNCICLLQIVPFNYDLAKFCFSHSKFFLVKKKTTPAFLFYFSPKCVLKCLLKELESE